MTMVVGFVVLALAGSPACPNGSAELAVDGARSTVKWKGTKFFGLGSHEGIVRLSGGQLCLRGDDLVGGAFTASLASIEVTDIPADDPVPRKNLRDHLLSADFFDASRHPEARLEIRSAVREKRGLYRVTANLSMRGQTHPIDFYARAWTVTNNQVHAQARFKVDRHRWGVSFRGSSLRDDLVDDEFWLEISLEARSEE